MAGSASLVLETAFVRIGVAVVAFAERNAFVSGSALRVGRVALLALYFLVKTGQGVTGLAVIELTFRVLPVNEVVALNAIWAETPFVKVFVARGAGLRDPEESPAEILHLDGSPLGGRNLIGRVAFI